MIFGVAVFNFAFLRTLEVRMGHIAALVDPWYRPWSYLNEPTCLLLTTSLLLVNRIWSYLIAIGISAYIVARYVYCFAFWDGTWLWEWAHLRKYDLHVAAAYESQILLAAICLGAGLYYLSSAVFKRTASRSSATLDGSRILWSV